MHTKTILTIALAVTAGLIGSSCGDDEALTKPEFIEQADAICQAGTDEVTPIIDEFWEGLDDDFDWDDPANQDVLFTGFAEVMDETAPIWKQQSADIRELSPPKDDRALIADLLDDFDAQVDEMVRLTDAMAAGDEEARAFAENDEDPLAEVNRRAREYGLVVCGEEDF